MKITFASKAWISQYNCLTPEQLQTAEGASSLYYSPIGLGDGYTFAGDAVITVEIIDEQALVANKIEALREHAASIRAEATAKCTRIDGQIQQLLSIENKPSSTPLDDYLSQ